MKIRERQRLNTWVSMSLILLMISALAWSFWEGYQADRNMLLSDEIQKVIFDRGYLRDEYLLTPNEQAKSQWHTKSETLRALLESAAERFKGTEDRAFLKEARKNFDLTFFSFSEVLDQIDQEEHSERKTHPFGAAEARKINQVFLFAKALNDDIDRLHESSYRAMARARNKGVIIVIFLIAGSFIGILINSILFSRILAKGIEALHKGVKIIGAGNLDYRVDVEGDNELSELSRATNEMIENLKASQEYVESIINAVPEPLIVLDQDLRVVKASRSFYEVFKVSPEETLGKLVYDLGNKQWDIPKLRKLLETILPEKATFDNYEVEHDFSGVGRRTMLLNARQIQRVQGKVRIILLAIEDITERREAENNLKKAHEELEAFTYSVSHDLRAPLRGIDGWSLALLEDCKDKIDDQGRQYIDLVRSETQIMGRLIDDLLTFSRQSRSEMNRRPLDMTAMAQAIISHLQQLNPTFHADFIIQPGLTALGDSGLIEIALKNLLDNAAKFSSKSSRGVIEFGQVDKEGRKTFFVRDNGVGFDMAYSNKLFGVFRRLHKASEFPGTGIGLASVQRIINRHGGRIWAEAKINQGATFYFTLKEAT
jgi:PAS domain S-box-containing protein